MQNRIEKKQHTMKIKLKFNVKLNTKIEMKEMEIKTKVYQ